MKHFLKLLALVTLFAGCGSTSKIITGPDGTNNLLIEGGSIESCYKEARKMCKGAYKIIDSNSTSANDYSYYSLLVKCDQ